jgi:hypothetical protein
MSFCFTHTSKYYVHVPSHKNLYPCVNRCDTIHHYRPASVSTHTHLTSPFYRRRVLIVSSPPHLYNCQVANYSTLSLTFSYSATTFYLTYHLLTYRSTEVSQKLYLFTSSQRTHKVSIQQQTASIHKLILYDTPHINLSHSSRI